jgi:polar amino acid transport system substrate-binding protein
MRTRLLGLLPLILLTSCGLLKHSSSGSEGSLPKTLIANRDVVSALAPSGTLRAAINFGNPILARRGPAVNALGSAPPRGVSVDIAQELGRRLGVPVQLVTFEAAGQVVEGLRNGAVDLVFVAIDPVRGADILYSAPYVVIEGSYLVPQASAIRRNEDVDRPGVRVVVGKGSAYDLFLSRELKAATLVQAVSSPAVSDLLVAGHYEVAAGVKQQLQADAQRLPGLRLLDGRFMEINQALGIPKSRETGLAYLRAFVEELKSTGFVEKALARHGIAGAAVAPAAVRAGAPVEGLVSPR